MSKEPKNVIVGMVYVDQDNNGNPLVGDIHVVVKEIDRLMLKFKPKFERMKVAIFSELVERVDLGEK